MQDGSRSAAELDDGAMRAPELGESAQPNSSRSLGAGDGRRVPRRRVLLTGKLTYGDGLSMDCAIREESDIGARVVVGPQLLPRQVVLVSVTRGVAYEAQVMWRRGKEAGLRFLKAHPFKSDALEPLSQVELARKLWAETLARGSD